MGFLWGFGVVGIIFENLFELYFCRYFLRVILVRQLILDLYLE